MAKGSALLFQAFFVGMPASVEVPLFQSPHFVPGGLVVQVIELIDDLKRPASVEGVAAHDLVTQPGCVVGYACRLKKITRKAKLNVATSHELVKRVEMATSAFDVFERFGGLSDRRYPLVGFERVAVRGFVRVALLAHIHVPAFSMRQRYPNLAYSNLFIEARPSARRSIH
jgi:hypothetical protein